MPSHIRTDIQTDIGTDGVSIEGDGFLIRKKNREEYKGGGWSTAVSSANPLKFYQFSTSVRPERTGVETENPG
jgi:hypothetical protein